MVTELNHLRCALHNFPKELLLHGRRVLSVKSNEFYVADRGGDGFEEVEEEGGGVESDEVGREVEEFVWGAGEDEGRERFALEEGEFGERERVDYEGVGVVEKGEICF